jgi:hypothetical protein
MYTIYKHYALTGHATRLVKDTAVVAGAEILSTPESDEGHLVVEWV